MSTRFYMKSEGSDQANFDNHFRAVRVVELQITGLREKDLTSEQRSALDAYVAAQKSFYLAEWGIAGPHGNVLRVESEQETITRWAWEESIKPAWLKLKERVELAALAYWQEHIEEDLTGVRVVWSDQVAESDQTYEVEICYQDYDGMIADIAAYMLLAPQGDDIAVESCLCHVPCDGERDDDE